ncbi:phosphonate ABC transporter, permease protein PhnE [Alkalibacillus haloalkaliphilus]|uniref:phosphonate ABC transporter, permease protein PhnE n=1 Tax=Alkalibacillus haloalkaliphilus TaxID=94136 RepID=UPI000302F5CB|nr:phosphonate ABC transporter, permease protein PhnE [Alkalibacillus haloalkaliphilus]
MSNKMSKPTINEDNYAPLLSPWRVKAKITVIFFVIIIFLLFSSWRTGVDLNALIWGFSNMTQITDKLFPLNMGVLGPAMNTLFETIHMAIIASTFSTLVVIPVSLLAANNITTNWFIYNTTRLIMNILRTIPDVVLAVIFVGLFGIGVFGGIVALFIFSLGILAKLISETIESVDMHPVEAMRASGANTIQAIAYGVVPQVLPQFTSFSLYVFEINIRASVVIGLVGAGGIGQLLMNQFSFNNYGAVMTIIIVIFAVVILIEYISGKIREAII